MEEEALEGPLDGTAHSVLQTLKFCSGQASASLAEQVLAACPVLKDELKTCVIWSRRKKPRNSSLVRGCSGRQVCGRLTARPRFP